MQDHRPSEHERDDTVGAKAGWLEELKSVTPARVGVGRAGTRPLTSTMLQLRLDHAAAVDAVYSEVSSQLMHDFGFHTVDTISTDKENYLKRPDRGRRLTEEGAAWIAAHCVHNPDVQIVVSDGLSAAAIEANLADVYPALIDSLQLAGLQPGTTFFVKRGRVACMDQIGEILRPKALVLLIGERPGLVSARSMSAYMCYQPRFGVIESDRNVISNIHIGGTPPVEAGAHIGTMLKAMIDQGCSGTQLVI
jgi:ethanolamine ammonia-lyase small subunit